MGALTNQKIQDSYPGLLNTADQGALDPTSVKTIQDGLGNPSALQLAQGAAIVTGEVILQSTSQQAGITINDSNDTVLISGEQISFAPGVGGITGLPEAGLVAGTGADSMQSAASLTTIAADATGAQSIAIGDGACSTGVGSTAVGDTAKALANGAVVLGGTSSGVGVTASGVCSIAIGQRMSVGGECAIGIGYRADTFGNCGISIGTQAGGNFAWSIAIGASANANAECAVALGAGVTAAKANTVSVVELETQLAGGGIYLTTPDGLAQPKLTVDNTCALLLDGTPVGGGGAAGLVNGTGADSLESDASLTTVAANASGTCSIALGNGACASSDKDIAIGCLARTSNSNSISIGTNAKNTNSDCSIAIGMNSCVVGWSRLIAIGSGACHVGSGYGGASIGCASVAYGPGVSIGNQAKAAANIVGVSIGDRTCVTANGAVALGTQVVAAKADTVTVKELETCVAGGGITLKSVDLTEEKVTLTDADVLAVGGDTIPANDTATPKVVNRIWSGSQAEYDALGTYDANTLYYIV